MGLYLGRRREPGGTEGNTTLIGVSAGVAVLLLAAGAAAFLLMGRTASGAVVSLATGEPIPNASLESAYGGATTDEAGRFTLSKLRLGTQAVTVTVDGFEPFKASLRVAPLGGGENEIALPDASAILHVEETALQPKDVSSAKVEVNGRAASAAASGTYEIKGLRPGEATVTVTGPSHEPTKTTITLKPGKNDVRVRVRLTAAETYVRYFEAYKAGKWAAAYAYLHPDVAKLESLPTYTKHMQDWGKPLSIQMESARVLGRWLSPYTKLTYTNVAEIRRTLITEKGGARIQSALPQHWTEVDGLWLRVDI